ncbi:hypothetical protein [Robiginitomaculum antarcticum]|uniref:hypothetical protein n=1 Tax=Robiginitomaculum antarcticum TaxID=437507 RepID=UPI00037CBAAC|nr:hypothetical protein [Robiginitomaculum antarcticum]
MKFLYSGDRGQTGHKERVDIIGTPAQLRAIGTFLTTVTKNTAFKGHTGVTGSYPINLAALKIMLANSPDAKLEMTVPKDALTLTAGKDVFRLLGESILASFKTGDVSDYEIVVTGIKNSPIMDNPRRDLYFRSEMAQSTTISEDFSGNNSGRAYR